MLKNCGLLEQVRNFNKVDFGRLEEKDNMILTGEDIPNLES